MRNSKIFIKTIALVIFFFAGINLKVATADSVQKPTNPAEQVASKKDGWNPPIIRRATPQPLKVFVLDVGQGDSIFIEFPYGETMLVDAGSWDSYGIPHIKTFLRDYFKANKYKDNTIDVVVASHPDSDHIKGLRWVISNCKVNWYIDNGLPANSLLYRSLMRVVRKYDKKDKIDYVAIKENNAEFQKKGFYDLNGLLRFKDVNIYVLGSYEGEGEEDVNNASVVMKIAYENNSIILTGDAEGKNLIKKDEYLKANSGDFEENRIYKRLQAESKLSLLDSDVLKVGHHGSHHSATELFLEAVTPLVSVVSVGDYRISSHAVRFGHPRLETLDRLDKYTTDKTNKHIIKAYKDTKTPVDFVTDRTILATSAMHELKGKTVKKYGDLILLFNGSKVSIEGLN